MHACDTGACTGGNRSIAVVAYHPGGAAVLCPTALSRRKGDRQSNFAPSRSGVNRRSVASQPLVDATAKRHHGNGCQNGKDGPLRPRWKHGCGCHNQACSDGRAAHENKIKLRIHQGELRPEKYRAGDHPTPPGHLGIPRAAGGRTAYRPLILHRFAGGRPQREIRHQTGVSFVPFGTLRFFSTGRFG